MRTGTTFPRLGSAEEMAVPGLVRAAHGFEARPASLEGVDPELLWSIADRHRVLPSVWRAAGRLVAGNDRAGALARLRAISLRQAALRRFTARLAEAFERADVRFLIIKGQALESCYGGIMRAFHDIDLLVDPANLSRAAGALENMGMRRRPAAYDGTCTLESGLLQADLHGRLLGSNFPALPDTALLFERSVELDCPSIGRLRTLSDEDHLLLLIGHGFKHQWCRLVWILDLALFARRVPPMRIEAALSTARDRGLGRAADIAFDLAARLLSPGDPAREPRSLLIERLATRYQERLFDPGSRWTSKLENLALHLLSLERPKDGVRYLSRRLLSHGTGLLSHGAGLLRSSRSCHASVQSSPAQLAARRTDEEKGKVAPHE